MLYYKDCDFDLGIKKILMSFQEEQNVDKYTEILVDWTKRQLEDLDNVLGEILDDKDGLMTIIAEHRKLIYDILSYVQENQKKLEKLDIKSDNVKEQIDAIASNNETIIDNIENLDGCYSFYGDDIKKIVKNIRDDLGGLLD